jgi:hypothetical protein
MYSVEARIQYHKPSGFAETLTLLCRHDDAENIAHEIAATRNIAATWDINKVTLDGKDVTREVSDEYFKLYGYRRAEFV